MSCATMDSRAVGKNRGRSESAGLGVVAAVSVPYLKLWGTVTGGLQIARSALIADAKLGAADDADFYRTEIATARFYAEHILPQAQGFASAVVNGAGSVLELSNEQF